MPESRRILSIQSHVTSGFVGNRAATFPLQVLGWDVDAVNTVQYSNHAGYGRFGGAKTSVAQLESVFQGMRDNNLMHYTRLLTGYVPGGEILKAIDKLARELKAAMPSLIYLLDPVIGDDGRLYVDADVIPVYRGLLPLATIITPNWFEVEQLTKTRLDSLPALQTALRILHTEHKVPNVVISSLIMKPEDLPPQANMKISTPPSDIHSTETILCVCSSAQDSVTSRVHAIRIRKIRGYFSGVGDLFSALVLAHYKPDADIDAKDTAISSATTIAIRMTQSILHRTQTAYMSGSEEDRPDTDVEKDKADPSRRSRRTRARELRLVQSVDVLQGMGQVYEPMEEWQNFWSL